MKKTTVAAALLAGLLAGYWISQSNQEVLAQAPGRWDCRSWTLGADIDAGVQLGAFLGNANDVQLTSGALSSSKYALVACRR